jgi:hypothetical protein
MSPATDAPTDRLDSRGNSKHPSCQTARPKPE